MVPGATTRMCLLAWCLCIYTSIPFPDMPFSEFSGFVESHFGPDITLCTVLTILFSVTENTALLNLHARQQHPTVAGEIRQQVSGWMKAFVWTLQRRLGSATNTLFRSSDGLRTLSSDGRITCFVGQCFAWHERVLFSPDPMSTLIVARPLLDL